MQCWQFYLFELAEKELKKVIYLTIVTEKYLGINLTKKVRDICKQNYKIWIK